MAFPLSTRAVPLLDVRETCASTNSELAELARESDLPEYATVLTFAQSSGRGRLGRQWSAPPGTSAAVSVLIHVPESAAADLLGWLPLAAGAAMAATVAAELPGRPVSIKWPNDVLVGDRKICGILAEIVRPGQVVLGAGLNVSIEATDLPVATATSLGLEGAVRDAEQDDRVVATYLQHLRGELDALKSAGYDAERSGLAARVSGSSATVGRDVHVELPDGSALDGRAVRLDPTGRLVVATDLGERTVSAGDVRHVRGARGLAG